VNAAGNRPRGTDVDEIWQRIERWLSRNAKPVFKSLRPPASESEIAAAEDALSRPLPDDFRQSLLRHDGQRLSTKSGTAPGFHSSEYLLPLKDCLEYRQMMVELLGEGIGKDLDIDTEGPVRAVWWDRAWLPFTLDGMNNTECLDLHPARGGRKGQVIEHWSQEHTRLVNARSFLAWLGGFADGLDAGEYVYAKEYNGVITRWAAVGEGLLPGPLPPYPPDRARNWRPPRRGKPGRSRG
jgi:cell wall assembly regulator SMI1